MPPKNHAPYLGDFANSLCERERFDMLIEKVPEKLRILGFTRDCGKNE